MARPMHIKPGEASLMARAEDDLRSILARYGMDLAIELHDLLRTGDMWGGCYTSKCCCLYGVVMKRHYPGMTIWQFFSVTGHKKNSPAELWWIRIGLGDSAANSEYVAAAMNWIERWVEENRPVFTPLETPATADNSSNPPCEVEVDRNPPPVAGRR